MKFRNLLLTVLLGLAPMAFAQPPPIFAALSVTKTDSADPVLPGAEYNYVLTVLNIGTETATNVVLHDRLPTNVVFVSAATPTGAVAQVSTNVTFTIPTLGENASVSMTVRVQAASSGLITNRVTATASNATSSASDFETTYILSDLRIAMAASQSVVQRTASFSYSLIFSNAGAVALTNVVVSNTLPAQVTFVSANVSAGAFVSTPSSVVFSVGALAAGGTAGATVDVTAVLGGAAVSRATARGYAAGSPVEGLGEATVTILGSASDLSGDGVGDLLLQQKGGGVLYIQAMNGTEGAGGTFPLGGTDISPWRVVATADFNRDGQPELVARYRGFHLVGVLATGTVVGSVHLFGVETDLSPWGVVAGGDFNGDGYGDLLFQKGDSGVYAVVLQKNNKWISANYLGGAPVDITPFRILAAGDTDGDGRADLVVREGNSGVYGIVKVNGWAIQSGWYLTGARVDVRPWVFRAASDIDGDGVDELIFQDGAADKYGAAFMNGYTIQSSANLFTNGLDVSAWNVIGPR
ncbi:MAG TPA: FG-GAP-like repeat-containing protein [Kiritimatiellia bacterium]|nr:FG-GAP-like repeat-containing protein [Kiritimatiellia bacterium]